MRRYLHLAIIAGISLALSALTVPMCFWAFALEARSEHGSIAVTLIRFIWSWGVLLSNATSLSDLSEPGAQLLMYGINFLLYCTVLCLAYRIYRVVHPARDLCKCPMGGE